MSLRDCCMWTATAFMLSVPPVQASFNPAWPEWTLLACQKLCAV